ncbi:MAG: hypothetical protein Kow0090_20030 [Myxococcota bacterium]
MKKHSKETRRILIVEDEPDVLKLERQILETAGYLVDTALKVDDALEKLEDRRYDLVITDIMMPGMNGYELADVIRDGRFKKNKDVPIIMVTAKTDPKDMSNGFNSGAVVYLMKPFTRSTLLTSVKTILPVEEDGKKKN